VTPLPHFHTQSLWLMPLPRQKGFSATEVAVAEGEPTESGLHLLPIIRTVGPAREDV